MVRVVIPFSLLLCTSNVFGHEKLNRKYTGINQRGDSAAITAVTSRFIIKDALLRSVTTHF